MIQNLAQQTLVIHPKKHGILVVLPSIQVREQNWRKTVSTIILMKVLQMKLHEQIQDKKVKATIIFTSKSLRLELQEPMVAQSKTVQLPVYIGVRFALPGDKTMSAVTNISVYETAVDLAEELLQRYGSRSQEEYVLQCIEERSAEVEAWIQQHERAQFSQRRKKLKEEFKRGVFETQQEYSEQIAILTKEARDLERALWEDVLPLLSLEAERTIVWEHLFQTEK